MVLHSLSTTQSQNEARPPCCNCDAGDLLKHAINLIDPPLYSVDDSTIPVRTAKGSELNVGNAISEHSPICNTVENQSHDDLKVTTKKKKVQFNEPSCNERKKISVKDAIRAYEYLSHAIDIESGDFCDETIPALISWSKFQHRADSFRALLVTCNLLLEMLPDDHDTDTNNHVSFDDKCGMICPKLAINQLSSHYLTQATIKQLLSSSRRCILSLKYIERMCAAKAITERHTGSVKTFYTGGDDIEDYDRCTNDLHMDYDWHDDGYLPEPALYSDNTTTNTAGTSLLHECCYRPHTLSVQPSSRYEKSASTKKLVRGERLISMSLDEYGYQERYTSEQTNEKDYLTNDSNCWSASGLDENQDESITKRNIDRTTESPIQDKEDAPFFTLSPSALAKEEQHLLDIMVSCNPTNLMDAASSKPKKKKRKQKQSQMQMLQPDSASYNSHTNNPYFDWKEGYLLFGHNDHALPITRKVYAKLHPSGWLSIEDRSSLNILLGNVESASSKMPHRTRYWDYFITRSTTCQPCISGGTMSFHFRVDGITLLASSALDKCNTEANSVGKNVNLLFAVDETTGGALADGFEWVSAISKFSSYSQSLHECVCSYNEAHKL